MRAARTASVATARACSQLNAIVKWMLSQVEKAAGLWLLPSLTCCLCVLGHGHAVGAVVVWGMERQGQVDVGHGCCEVGVGCGRAEAGRPRWAAQ